MPVKLTEIHPESMGNYLDSIGITREALAEELKRELHAFEVKPFYDSKKGQVVYSKKMPIWSIKQKARIDAHRLRGDYPVEKRELSLSTTASVIDTVLGQAGERERGRLPSELGDDDDGTG